MTHMGVEKTTGSIAAGFGSTETLNSYSGIPECPFHDLLQEGARICVNGLRGSGKSTLLTKIETDWTNCFEYTQDYGLLFHIDCADLKPNEEILTYIKRCNLPKLKESDEDLLSYHLGRGSDGIYILFLLDNIDHLIKSDNTLSNDDILNLLTGKSYPFSCVISTSRHQSWKYKAMSEIVFDKNITIKGFSEVTLKDYIKFFFDNGEEVAKHEQLLKLLDDQQVFSLLRYPLHINFFLFATSNNPIQGRTELYTHVLRALLSQVQGREKSIDDAVQMLYNKRQLRTEVLPDVDFVVAAGEVAFANMVGNDFDVNEESRNIAHQNAVDVGLLAIATTDRDQNNTQVYVVQHKELTEYLATIYLASFAMTTNDENQSKRRKSRSLRRTSLMKNSDLLKEKLKILSKSTSSSGHMTGILDVVAFSASVSIGLFQTLIKHCVSALKDACYDELRATREWHSTVGNMNFQTMNSLMDAFLVAYAEVPTAWKGRVGHVFRILTNKAFVMFGTRKNIHLATKFINEMDTKIFSGIKGILLVYRSGKGFSNLLQALLKKCMIIKYLHILFYLDLPSNIPMDYSDFKVVPLPQGEKVHLDLILSGGQKVLDLFGVPLHNLSTRALQNVHNIRSLCLREAKLTEEDGGSLAEIIKALPKLEVLNLHNNPNLQQGLRPVIGVLHQNSQLRTLDLSRTGLTLEAWSDLQSTLTNLKRLEFLELSMNLKLGTWINKEKPTFDKIKNLKELHLRDSGLDLSALNVCLVKINSISSLRVLDILDNNIDIDAQDCELLSFINESTKLQHLFIHGNIFSREWLSDLVANRKVLKVDAECDPKRCHLETRFVTDVCVRVGNSIKSAPSGRTVSLYLLDEIKPHPDVLTI